MSDSEAHPIPAEVELPPPEEGAVPAVGQELDEGLGGLGQALAPELNEAAAQRAKYLRELYMDNEGADAVDLAGGGLGMEHLCGDHHHHHHHCCDEEDDDDDDPAGDNDDDEGGDDGDDDSEEGVAAARAA
eukprot:RCo034962